MMRYWFVFLLCYTYMFNIKVSIRYHYANTTTLFLLNCIFELMWTQLDTRSNYFDGIQRKSQPTLSITNIVALPFHTKYIFLSNKYFAILIPKGFLTRWSKDEIKWIVFFCKILMNRFVSKYSAQTKQYRNWW